MKWQQSSASSPWEAPVFKKQANFHHLESAFLCLRSWLALNCPLGCVLFRGLAFLPLPFPCLTNQWMLGTWLCKTLSTTFSPGMKSVTLHGNRQEPAVWVLRWLDQGLGYILFVFFLLFETLRKGLFMWPWLALSQDSFKLVVTLVPLPSKCWSCRCELPPLPYLVRPGSVLGFRESRTDYWPYGIMIPFTR